MHKVPLTLIMCLLDVSGARSGGRGHRKVPVPARGKDTRSGTKVGLSHRRFKGKHGGYKPQVPGREIKQGVRCHLTQKL